MLLDSAQGLGGVQEAPAIIDVGSGGGLPGVIIAIARPTWQVTHVGCSLISTIVAKVQHVFAVVISAIHVPQRMHCLPFSQACLVTVHTA